MIVEYIRYDLKDHSADELRQAYDKAAEHLRATAECLGYELIMCAEDASRLTLRILWSSAEGHMQQFRRGPNFRPFFMLIQPFLGEIAEMRHYEPTDVVWSRGAFIHDQGHTQ